MSDAANETQVDGGTAVEVYRWLREVCTTRLTNSTRGILLFRLLSRYKPKVTNYLIHVESHARLIPHRIIEDGQLPKKCGTPALGYMEVVNSRSAAILLPLIQAAYSGVVSLPNVSTHDTVNHSIEFVQWSAH